MNVYAIWVDLVDGREDLAFAQAVQNYLGYFERQGLVHAFSIERRKFGFGPDHLGEFHVRILTNDLETLDRIFMQAATRDGEVEHLHSEVFRRVQNFRSGLYRSFPDDVRKS